MNNSAAIKGVKRIVAFYARTLALFTKGIKIYYAELLEALKHWRYWGKASYIFYAFARTTLYFFRSPEHVNYRYWFRHKKGDYLCYGETPLTIIENLAHELSISPKDHVYDLGAGTGAGLSWLALFRQCQVTGIEHNPGFIWRANILSRLCRMKRARFVQADALAFDYSDATVIYLYGTTLPDSDIKSAMLCFCIVSLSCNFLH